MTEDPSSAPPRCRSEGVLFARLGPTPPADGGDSRSIILSDGSQYAETTFGTPMSVLGKDVIRFDVATVGLSTPGGNWLNVSLKLVPA